MATSRSPLLLLLRTFNSRPCFGEVIPSLRLRSRRRNFLTEPGFHTSSQKQQTQIKRYGQATEPDLTPGSDAQEEVCNVVLLEHEQESKEVPIEASKPSLTPPLLEPAAGTPDRVLHMEAPTEERKSLHAPQHIHHFDTYTLVQDLAKGGFSDAQSVTIMKAIRALLARNLKDARDGLICKSDVENESYLFRAASSELRTEIQNSRTKANEKMRTERAHLQHEADILSQKVTQESLTLKDELRGMSDNRKMAVRMEQRSMESAIQELNYKITVALTSDSKGEVEALRWYLTRRAVLFIAGMALLILGSLRYSSYMTHLQEMERHKMEQSSRASGDGREGSNTMSRGDSGAVLASLESVSSPNFVSLG